MTQLEVMRKQIEVLERIEDILKRIEFIVMPANKASVIELAKFKINNGQEEGWTDMNLQIGENARVAVTAIKDAAGNAARVEGDVLVWSISGDQNVGSLEVAPDMMSALFVRSGAVGTCKVEVKGDADLGAGVKEIVGEVEIVCLGGEAVVFELSAQAEPAVQTELPV